MINKNEEKKEEIIRLTEMPKGLKNLMKKIDYKCFICNVLMSEHPIELFEEHITLVAALDLNYKQNITHEL